MVIDYIQKRIDQALLSFFFDKNFYQIWYKILTTPGPRLMRIHLVRNSTSAKFQKSPKIHLVRPIIHLVRIFALSD